MSGDSPYFFWLIFDRQFHSADDCGHEWDLDDAAVAEQDAVQERPTTFFCQVHFIV